MREGAPSSPSMDAALGPSLLQWQVTPAKSFWRSYLHPLSHFTYPHPQKDASCCWKLDLCFRILSLCSETTENWAICSLVEQFAWVHQRPDMRGRNFCLPQPLRQRVWMCVWIFMYVPCTHECMNWRKLLQGRVLNNKVCLAWSI